MNNKNLEVEMVKTAQTIRYYIKGTRKLHREDGPAYEFIGDKYSPDLRSEKEWWLNGQKYSISEYLKKIDLNNIQNIFPLWKGDFEDLRLFIETGLFSENELLNILKNGQVA
jgi:hypothetical protein